MDSNPALTFPLLPSSPHWTHFHSTIPSIIEMFGGIWAMSSRETQTLINLHYSPLFPPSLSLPHSSLSPSISYKCISISLRLYTHSQRPLSAALLQGIWFFNEDSNNDYGYFKTVCLPRALMEAEKPQCLCFFARGPVRWCRFSRITKMWSSIINFKNTQDDKYCVKVNTGIKSLPLTRVLHKAAVRIWGISWIHNEHFNPLRLMYEWRMIYWKKKKKKRHDYRCSAVIFHRVTSHTRAATGL